MTSPDLPTLRRSFEDNGILLCFNGPISRSLIEEVGMALRAYLDAEQGISPAAMDVFAVYIEMTQNIRHYAREKGFSDIEATVTVTVARDGEGRYVVSAGNVIEIEDGRRLVERVAAFDAMDKPALKAAYKQQLRKPREAGSSSGSGLGLIDIARRSSAPLATSLVELANGRGLFTLTAVI
jgi:hypothetical protein